MGLEGPRFELGMKLHADEPWMVLVLDHFGQQMVRRHSGKAHPVLLEPVLVAGIDLVAVAMALGNLGRAVNLAHSAPPLQDGRIGAEPHCSAEIAVYAADLEL